ncbi:response regulator [Microvirga lotononidis]|uniref:Response regulator with CheY-like receiver, AAA-type ATPase, and DNA-binding domains n=1 Tax=Microvirga lotononidis TaxID=864069 RepID=I4Z4P4_9HYPH|nr:response regulator [Microvirga lotononidis]EIM31186.1 response regulator with CheY-like receiver, AAA-type ATPase, and DNA-binding domains [Microvirga lotononidis]WQO30423.1 response regulator [Microvirga lotononidis]
MRVLVVDDDANIRDILVEALTDDGLEVVQAASGEEALHYLTVTPPIDVLFTDIRMPGGVNGWELARRFRAASPSIGVVYASGYVEDGQDLVPGGIFLDKPARIADLLPALLAAKDSG